MTFSTAAVCKHARRPIGACTASLLLCLAFPGASFAQSASAGAAAIDKSEWESGWHVIRPGDTLEGLSERFLGSSEHWRELHLLNPFVKDPDLLYPGQRLRIFLERPTARLSAQIMAVARDVRELPTPVSWRPANEGDVLLERDALRTAKSSSARLRFDDGATVTLSEDSLVFIRRQTPSTSSLPKKEIEIQLGQIDVEGAPADSGGHAPSGTAAAEETGRQDAIEVVVAGARSLATREGGQPLSTRSRRGTDDLAQFMVFSGKSTVSSAGRSIDVPAGSGTSVAPQAPPGPVEALLPAPSNPRPAYGEEIEQAAPQFSWSPVPGADHYTVEVCRDSACGAIVARAPTFTAGSLQLDIEGGLPAGELFWRVTAVAASGLDGFPTGSIRVQAVEAIRPNAPTLTLRTAAGLAVPSGSCLAAIPDLEVQASARQGMELPWRLVIDGRESAIDEMRTLPLAGNHQVAARVTDPRGRTADSPAVSFTLDSAAPWVDLVTTVSRTAAVADASETPTRKPSRGEKEPAPIAVCDTGLEAQDAGGNWLAVPCTTATADIGALVVALDPLRPASTLR